MKNNLHYFLLLTGLSLFAAIASAQGLQPDSIKWQLVKDWERAKAYTNEYLAAMPADKYDARAVDSIRSFAEQMLHLSVANIGLTSAATGAPLLYPPGYLFSIEKSKTAQSRDSVNYYVNTSYDYAINSIKNMDASKLWETTEFFKRTTTRFALLEKAFEHQTHHRGQTTIYIRLQGIRPPGEKLF